MRPAAGVSRRRALAALGAVVAGLAAPGPRGAAAAPLAVVDMLGREVRLPAPPRRIVSLVPSATETIFALGGEDLLVGVTDFCDYPPAARSRPSVGGMIAPSLEAIVALRPDLVIVTDAGNDDATLVQLARLGLPHYAIHASRLRDVMDIAARLGRLTGREDAVAPLVRALERRIAAVEAAVRPFPRPRVLYVLWPDPLIVPGRDAHVTEMIARAGGDSVTADEPSDYPRFSIEAAVARAPEVVLLARHDGGVPLARDRWERLQNVPAVRAGRVHAVDGSLMHRYGPRVVEGLEQLARAIHPEAFR